MRRSQLVAPFGVGAMSVLVDGTSVITAGLDYWFDHDQATTLDEAEYQEYDWRLQERLHVSGFRLPPDHRRGSKDGDNRNVGLRVPVLRFPLWSFCMYCKRLERATLTRKVAHICPDAKCQSKGYRTRMAQVPFVAVCKHGHLDDFPFNEWVHRLRYPGCSGPLRLKSRGGGGLEGQVVACDACGKERSLRGIMESRTDPGGVEHTNLSDQLIAADDPYLCTGSMPWLAEPASACSLPMRGALRAAGNVYFPKVESSIYLPPEEGGISAELHEFLRHPGVRTGLGMLREFVGIDITPAKLRNQLMKHLSPEVLNPHSDDNLMAAYLEYLGSDSDTLANLNSGTMEILTGDDEWRYPEYMRIREEPQNDYLAASDPGVDHGLARYLARVRSVDALRETRALRGFTRVNDDALRLSVGKHQLRRHPLPPEQDWLPAYVVRGEGIYIELDDQTLSEWERHPGVRSRAQKITDHYGTVASARGLEARALGPRFVMLHTLAHLLINELVFTCGYSSASLRERLYVSDDPKRLMAGLLIYTAAGDSEGTMGGLVRMARPDNLAAVFRSAVTKAAWCSTDPVCMDAGEKGQGPESCNLAACHSCALLPETSCEEFNRFMDRGLVIGTLADPELGFLSSLRG
ncbi:DUF1998 domain-containing protein [Demequina aestuarii]|uniref:DUF1998 domain-containing protein n=1 Tax=Demequina aestuarii TaxID=327095 RepID=UPI0023789F30|nr:DUF1998 domain-containing protein [Demequina aestuarii]